MADKSEQVEIVGDAPLNADLPRVASNVDYASDWLTSRQQMGLTAQRAAAKAPATRRQSRAPLAGDKYVQDKFLEYLATTGSVIKACDAADVDRVTAFNERKRNQEFAQLWDEALERFAAWVEGEIVHRAVVGREKPVFHQGHLVALVHEPSDTLLLALARKTSETWRAALAQGATANVTVNASAVAGAVGVLGEDLSAKVGRLSPEKRAALRVLLDRQEQAEALPPATIDAESHEPATGKPGASGAKPAPIAAPDASSGPGTPARRQGPGAKRRT